MGANSSKEDDEDEGLPAKYARGIPTSEFSQQWRHHPKYKLLQERLTNQDMSKSCISIYAEKNREANPSVMLLGKAKHFNAPPRLQGIGIKQKSYINQLIEHRTKHMIEIDVNKKTEQKSIEPLMEELGATGEPNALKNVIKDGGELINKQNHPGNHFGEGMVGVKCEVKKKKNRHNKRHDSSSSSENTSSRPSSPSWVGSNSEESSLEANLSLADGLEHIRSDMTVVPYDQAKARFEQGAHKKRLKRSEDYVQLEQLGLGFWNNDQWVPTKVVTLAISDQLSCAGGDWPTNYRFRSNFNCQSFRSSFSEVQY